MITVLFLVIIALAAFVQGSTGFGFALIVAPIVGLLAPELLPAFLLALMIPLNAYVAWRERGHLDAAGARWITTGRAVGTGGGLWILMTVSGDNLSLIVGVSTVLAALASLFAPSFSPGRPAFVTAGVVTGITETATGIGGPPLALVYQHRPAAVLRSTVAVCFLVGELISLAVLSFDGRITPHQLWIAALALPALALGAILSKLVHHRINDRLMRALVLSFAVTSGVALLLSG